MLNQKELEQLKFFAEKVANVHWPEHSEFIEVNLIVKNIEIENLKEDNVLELRKLTNSYIIPKWACKAQTTLLNLLNKLDNNK